MYTSRKHSNKSKHFLIQLLILATVLIPSHRQIFASEESQPGSMLLVLENCDSDNKLSTDPYGDTVSLINPKGELISVIRRLLISDGPQILSVSEDGRFFAVCEKASDTLTVYEMATGKEVWSLFGVFGSAVFVKDMIYASNSNGIFAIDNTGTIVIHSRLIGCDIAVDAKHDCLWIVGLDVKKCNLDLDLQSKTKLTLDNKDTGAFSVDFDPIGSVWIAEQNVYQEYGSKNRLVKRSLHGDILKKINLDFSPIRVCVDSSDGSAWTTGSMKGPRDFSKIGDEWPETLDELNGLVKTETKIFTRKYDSEGNLIFEISEGGYSIELDQSDGSAWIGDKTNIWHYSAKGQKLGSYTGSPGARKWFTIVPDKNN